MNDDNLTLYFTSFPSFSRSYSSVYTMMNRSFRLPSNHLLCYGKLRINYCDC